MLSTFGRKSAAATLVAMVLASLVLIADPAGLFRKKPNREAEQPLFEERDLFMPGEGGYPVFRIPGIVVTKKGTLVAYAEARSGTSDWSTIDLVVKRSEDGGKTWGPLQVVVKNAPSENTTYNNPLMIAETRRDVLHFLYCKNYHEVFYMKSANEGKDWSSPVNITPTTIDKFRAAGQKPRPYAWKVVATGPGHGIELRNGRLLVPVWLANGPTDRSHGPSVVATIYSDDHGETWHTGEIVYETPETVTLGEPVAVELEDGSVMMNLRNRGDYRAVTVSPDGIGGWSVPKHDRQLTDPRNFASLARYSFRKEGHNRILFVNANDPAHRQNITLRMSEDDGRTWTYGRVIQPGQGAYSDVAVAGDKTIHVLYERGFGIKAVRLNAAWLTDDSQLDALSFDTGELSPAFAGGVYEYVLDVRANTSSVRLTAKLPVHSDAVIRVNGESVSSGKELAIPLNASGDTKISLLIQSPQGETRSEYGVTVRKSLPEGTLVGYWDFERITEDGIVPDASGNNNHGQAFGVSLAPGKVGNALQFSGNYVDIADPEGLAFGEGDFTASLWVKPDRLDEFMTLLWYGDVGAQANAWYVRTQQYDKMFFRTGGDGAETLAGTSQAVLTAGKWTHVAVRRKANEMKIYIDGQEAMTKVTTLTFNINGKNLLRIGKPMTGNTRSWMGMIDEVRLYNYALSETELRRLYEQTGGEP